jgi:Immunity protein 52
METYFIGAYWGDRKESVDACTDHVVRCLSALAKCDPAFSRWYRLGGSRKEAMERRFDVTQGAVKQLLLAGRNRRDIGKEVIEDLGFRISLWNGEEDAQDASFSAESGLSAGNPNLCNSCVINLPSEGPPSERLLRVEALLCLMRAVVDGFDPDWATVMPDSLLQRIRLVPNRPTPGWLFYISNRLFPGVNIPNTVRVVNVASQGQIAIITEDRFTSQNRDHLRARDAVESAIEMNFRRQP